MLIISIIIIAFYLIWMYIIVRSYDKREKITLSVFKQGDTVFHSVFKEVAQIVEVLDENFVKVTFEGVMSQPCWKIRYLTRFRYGARVKHSVYGYSGTVVNQNGVNKVFIKPRDILRVESEGLICYWPASEIL